MREEEGLGFVWELEDRVRAIWRVNGREVGESRGSFRGFLISVRRPADPSLAPRRDTA